MSALDFEPLWNKSKVFVRRALNARDNGEFADCCFWCSIALEILGKAALARVHPALVANPNHQDSLLAACGRPCSSDILTIPAKAVFSRIARLSKSFDLTQVEFSMQMLNRRNAELHSGSLPFAELDPQTWTPRYWKTCELILEIPEMTLKDWVGETEAERAGELITAAVSVLEQAVEARIEKHSRLFSDSYTADAQKGQIRKLALRGQLVHAMDFGPHSGDGLTSETCPACSCDGLQSGEYSGEIEESIIDEETAVEYVTVHYSGLAFRCGVCRLKLDGQEELRLAELPLEFDVEEEREIEYEDPYLND